MLSIVNSNSIVAENLKVIIKEKNIKQSALAQEAGFTTQEMNDMLNGRRLLRAADIASILNSLQKVGVDANALFKKDEKVHQ